MNEPEMSLDVATLALRGAGGCFPRQRLANLATAMPSVASGSETPAQTPERHRQRVAGLTACKVNLPPAGPGRAGPARLTCGQRAPPALTHFPFRPRRKQSPPPRCIGPAAEGGLSSSSARGRVSRDRTAVKRLAQPVNPGPKFLLVPARVVKKIFA